MRQRCAGKVTRTTVLLCCVTWEALTPSRFLRSLSNSVRSFILLVVLVARQFKVESSALNTTITFHHGSRRRQGCVSLNRIGFGPTYPSFASTSTNDPELAPKPWLVWVSSDRKGLKYGDDVTIRRGSEKNVVDRGRILDRRDDASACLFLVTVNCKFQQHCYPFLLPALHHTRPWTR